METQFSNHEAAPTLLQKLLQNYDITDDSIQSAQLPSLLRSISPNFVIDDKELSNVIAQYDRNGSGQLDFDSVLRIAFHFLLKQVSANDDLISNDRIGLQDFIIFPQL